MGTERYTAYTDYMAERLLVGRFECVFFFLPGIDLTCSLWTIGYWATRGWSEEKSMFFFSILGEWGGPQPIPNTRTDGRLG